MSTLYLYYALLFLFNILKPRVLRASGSEGGRGALELDVDALLSSRASLEATVLASAVPARRVLTSGESALQRIGAELFDRLFVGDVGTAYRATRAVAQAHGDSIQLRLRMTDAEIAALPWEALYDRTSGTYLCRKESLIRQIAAPESVTALRVSSPLRILGLIASPHNLQVLDVAGEKERLVEALAPLIDAGLARLEWIEDASWDRLHARLLADPWHVLHFIGHSSYDAATGEGLLAFCRADGRADLVGSAALADLLDEAEPSPRLVVLNSCMSGASGLTELFSGTAAALVRGGIGAVVAMQFTISDGAALAFARGFYAALAHGRSIDDATRSGRISILGLGRDTLEWVTPVLYLRGDDTQLFSVERPRGSVLPAPVPEIVPEVRAGSEAGAPSGAGIPEEQPERGATPEASDADARADSGLTIPVVPPPEVPIATAAQPPSDPPRRTRATAGLIIVAAVLGVVAVAAIGFLLATLLRPGDAPSEGSSASATAEPSSITTNVSVPGSQLWTSTPVTCVAGSPLGIRATGSVQHGGTADRTSGPDGMDGERLDTNVVDDANHAALIGRVGESGVPFLVGSSLDTVCSGDGVLFLGINDEGFVGNVGQFDVAVTHRP